MGRGHDDADAASIVTMLLAKGMPHVGLINGGYAEVLRLAELRLLELTDFAPPAAEGEGGGGGGGMFLASPLRHVTSALGDVTSNVSSKLGTAASRLETMGLAAADKAHVRAKAALGAVAADTQQLKAVTQSRCTPGVTAINP